MWASDPVQAGDWTQLSQVKRAPAGSRMMITVHVKLFATLRHLRPGLGIGESFAVELPDGATVDRLIRQLGLPGQEVKLVFINGIVRERGYALSDGDELGVFPPVGGG